MKEDDKNRKLTQLEIDNIIDESINMSIISKLLKQELRRFLNNCYLQILFQ